jgi:hypothetical protein
MASATVHSLKQYNGMLKINKKTPTLALSVQNTTAAVCWTTKCLHRERQTSTDGQKPVRGRFKLPDRQSSEHRLLSDSVFTCASPGHTHCSTTPHPAHTVNGDHSANNSKRLSFVKTHGVTSVRWKLSLSTCYLPQCLSISFSSRNPKKLHKLLKNLSTTSQI